MTGLALGQRVVSTSIPGKNGLWYPARRLPNHTSRRRNTICLRAVRKATERVLGTIVKRPPRVGTLSRCAPADTVFCPPIAVRRSRGLRRGLRFGFLFEHGVRVLPRPAPSTHRARLSAYLSGCSWAIILEGALAASVASRYVLVLCIEPSCYLSSAGTLYYRTEKESGSQECTTDIPQGAR